MQGFRFRLVCMFSVAVGSFKGTLQGSYKGSYKGTTGFRESLGI